MKCWTIILYQCLSLTVFLKCTIAYANNDTFMPSVALAKIDGRIVNGTKATIGQFPYIVSLRRSKTMILFCGGSVITSKWVITAAHCMFISKGSTNVKSLISPSSIVVVGGELKLNPKSFRRQKSYVTNRILNPKYDDDYLQNDVALLLLKTPFKINSFLKLTYWPKTMPIPGTKCLAAGWGYSAEDVSNISNDLMYAELPLFNQKKCKQLVGHLISVTPGLFCAGYEAGGKDACQGDSGGPLECNGALTGIVSGGLGCARPGYPGFYTNVGFYSDWINQVIHSNGLNTSYEGFSQYPEKKDSYSSGQINTLNLIHYCIIYFITFLYSI